MGSSHSLSAGFKYAHLAQPPCSSCKRVGHKFVICCSLWNEGMTSCAGDEDLVAPAKPAEPQFAEGKEVGARRPVLTHVLLLFNSHLALFSGSQSLLTSAGTLYPGLQASPEADAEPSTPAPDLEVLPPPGEAHMGMLCALRANTSQYVRSLPGRAQDHSCRRVSCMLGLTVCCVQLIWDRRLRQSHTGLRLLQVQQVNRH